MAGTADPIWGPKPGMTYRLEYSDDLVKRIEAAAAFPPGGAIGVSTSYRFKDIPPGSWRCFKAGEN